MKPSVINQPETTAKSPYTLHSTRSGSCWNYLLENKSSQDLCVAEVTLGCVDCPGCTFYGEGFNMLSQYGGPVEAPQDIGEYSDRAHYRMPTTPDAFTVYNFLHLTTPDGIHHLLAFASCHRFRGEFRLSGSRVTIVLNLEDYLLRPGEKLALEELFIEAGRDLEGLYDRMAACIASNHPRLLPRERSLSGWCSWYAYGEHLTRENLLDNLTFASREFPEVRYFLIDDGYENKLGDWLEPNPDCGDTGELCRIIREHGKKPAIWVAPFIAEKDSRLLAEHPDWFVQGDDGRPLCSADVTFGGWRRGTVVHTRRHPSAGTRLPVQGIPPYEKEVEMRLFQAGRQQLGRAAVRPAAPPGCNRSGSLPAGDVHHSERDRPRQHPARLQCAAVALPRSGSLHARLRRYLPQLEADPAGVV